MAFNLGDIFVTFKAKTEGTEAAINDFKQTINKIEDTTKKIDEFGKKTAAIGTQMSVKLTLPILAGFTAMVKGASDLNETLNKVDVAFADQAQAVKDWSKTAITQMGLAQGSALDAAALFGDMSTAMGLNTTQAKEMSTGLVQLGADMASFKNISFERAQTALAGIYTGETEALKGLGIVMTQANLATFAQNQGIKKNLDELTQAEMVQLRYNYVMSVTTNAQGDFVRTAEGTANQTRTTGERFKELTATLGQQLLPIVNRVLMKIQSVIAWFQQLNPEQQRTIIKIMAVVAAMGPLLVVIGKVIEGIAQLRAALTLLAAHPIVAIVMLIIGVFTGLFLILKKFYDENEQFRNIVNAVWNSVREAIVNAWNAIKAVMQPMIDIIVETAKEIWHFIQPILEAVVKSKAFQYAIVALIAVALLPLVAVLSLITAVVMIVVGIFAAVALAAQKYMEVIDNLNPTLDLFGNKQQKVTDAMNKQKKAHDDVVASLKKLKDAQDAASDAALGLEGSQLAVERSQRSYNDAVQQYGADSLEAREAAHSLKVSQEQLKDDTEKNKTATDELTKSQSDLTKKREDEAKAIQDAKMKQAEYNATVAGQPGLWEQAQMGASQYMSMISTGWNTLTQSIGLGAQQAGQWIMDAFGNVKSFLSGVWTNIQNGFTGAFNAIGGVVTGIGTTIQNIFKGAFNTVASFWNRTVGAMNFTIPDWVPGGLGGKKWDVPDLPMLAEGGVVSRATLAMIGEGSEPEAVIPLSKIGQVADNMGGGRGNTTIHVHLDGIMARSKSELRDIVMDGLKAVDERLAAQGKKTILGGAS